MLSGLSSKSEKRKVEKGIVAYLHLIMRIRRKKKKRKRKAGFTPVNSKNSKRRKIKKKV